MTRTPNPPSARSARPQPQSAPAPRRDATLAVRGGRRPDPSTGAIVAPLYQTTTYVQAAVGRDKGFTYSRASNPTVSALEAALGAFEGAPPAVAFKTGMAATTALCLATLRAGDRVVVGEAVYGGTVRLLREVLAPFGVEATFVDPEDTEALNAALADEPVFLFIETPANPTLRLVDIARAAAAAHAVGARLIVDNTFLTAALQRPLDLGADVVLYSTTKFIEGHDTTLGGALLTRDEALLARLRHVTKSIGAAQAPFDAWLTLRGLSTLPLRMKQHSEHALTVARWLEAQPAVARVHYPDLDSCPQRALATRQQRAGGGVLAFELHGGAPAGVALMNAVQLCSLAENLGAVETLITHPASMTHADVPRDQRARAGITDGLVRLSVGLEDPEDVIADLRAALAGAPRVAPEQEVAS
ncbi:MAG: PLP-dependent transferase [Planctomycetota bacterium]